jgi:hypothetical protein
MTDVGRSVHAANEDATVSAAGFHCLIPAAPAVPAAAAKQQNDKNDDEKRGAIHVNLLLGVPACFALHYQYNQRLLIPIRSHEMLGVGLFQPLVA